MMKNTLITLFLVSASTVFGAVSDYGMTSDAHAKHVGEIVFSSSPIQFQNEDPSRFAESFDYPDDKIFFMAYFPMSIANRCLSEHGFLPGVNNSKITFTFFVNGEETGTNGQVLNGDQLNKWTGWSDPNTPFGADKRTLPPYGFAFRDFVVPNLRQGDNEVRMVVGYEVQKDGQTYTNQTAVTHGTMIVKADRSYEPQLQAPPEAAMHDAQLEAKVKEALAFRWRKTTVVLEVILTEANWEVETNSFGVPVHRVLGVYAITHPKDGEYAGTCYATPFEVKQKYAGNNTYSDEIVWHSSGGRPNYEVACP